MIDYTSPITQIVSDMQVEYENGVLKAVQRVGFDVDKEELANALAYDRGQYEKGYEDGFNADKWIPCSERLPENDDYVLCWYEYKIMNGTRVGEMAQTYGIGYYFKRFHNWYGDVNNGVNYRVIAWQPLPAPYQKGE